MGTGEKVTTLGMQNAAATPRAHQQKILHACKQNADKYIGDLIKQVLDKLDDSLINRSGKEGSEADTEAYAEAERELHSKRQEISQEFHDNFTRNFKERLSRADGAPLSSKKGLGQGGGLSLVDEHELEESLAVDGLVARAKDRLRNDLYALAQRFNLLVDGAQYDDETQPLDPEVIGYAFRDVIHKLKLELEIKLIAYKLFEQGVMQTLGHFYHQTNSMLSDAGILSELKLSLPPRAAGGSSQSRSGELQDDQGAGDAGTWAQGQTHSGEQGGTQGSSSSSADVYQTLQKLMNARKYGDATGAVSMGGADGGEADSGAVVRSSLLADDLVRGLSLLQHDAPLLAPGGAINVAVIKDALLGQMKQIGDGRGIHPTHDNTIDVIGMIFEFILDEPSIPDVVKNLLNQLQIPILKIALVDKEFFTNKNHPARRLLNVLGHASIGWNDNDEAVRQHRFQKMEYVVNRVLAEFEQDPSIFASLLGEFVEFLAREGGDVEIEEVALLNDQPQEARPDRLAFEAIELRLEGAEVPGVLRDFLRNRWRDVLQYVLDHEGYDSDVWRQHEKMVDDLMWSVEPKTTADDRRKMVMLLPRLLDSLRDGMGLVACSQQEIDAVIDALEPIHMACLRGERHVAEAVKAVSAERMDDVSETSADEVSEMIRSIQDGLRDDGESMAAAEQVSSSTEISDFERELLGMDVSSVQEDADLSEPEPMEAIEDEFTTMAAEMRLGTWLEFDLGEKKRRGKLAWKSVVMGEYVFVDRRYKVVAERTLAGLAADLRHGKASLVEDVAMFDRALDKVLNGLMSGSSSTH